MHKTRLELWIDFYKAALIGRSGNETLSCEEADDSAARAADFAMARYTALEAKVMAEGIEQYRTMKLSELWGSGTMVLRG